MPAKLARHQAFPGNEPYFSWSAWAGDALWQLLPSDRVMQQRQKRDRFPSAARLRSA